MWQGQKSSKRWTGGGEGGGSVSLMFLVHFDVTCDLLLNSPTETQNLFANYMIKNQNVGNINVTYASVQQ